MAIGRCARTGIRTEDRPLFDCVGEVGRDGPELGLASDGVKRLLILPPADRTHPSLVVQVDTLPAERHACVAVLVLDLEPVEFGVHWVRNHRMMRPPLILSRQREGRGVVVVDQRGSTFGLGEQGKMSQARLSTGTQPESKRIGVQRWLLDMFIAQPGVQ